MSYVEHLEQYFAANDIDSAENKMPRNITLIRGIDDVRSSGLTLTATSVCQVKTLAHSPPNSVV
jgi:hypothetical protein